MIYIYITLFSIFFIWLAQKKFLWAIAFIVAFLPSYLIRFKIGFLPITLLELMILILFLVWLVKKKDRWTLGHFKYPIIFWLIIATVSIFTSPDLQSALGIWKAYFIESILFFIVLINVIKTTGSFADVRDDKKNIQDNKNDVILSPSFHSRVNSAKNPKVGAEDTGFFTNVQNDKGINLIFGALSFSALYISLFAIWQKFAGQGVLSLQSWQGEKILRVTSIFKYPNAIGLFLAPIILLLISCFFMSEENAKHSAIKKLFYWLAIFSSLLAIIFAKSEGALLGLVAGLIFFGLMAKITRKFTSIGLIIFTIILFSVAPLKNYFWQKATLSDFSGQIRKEMWGETWQMLKQKPIFGAGLAGYQNAMIPFHKKSYIEIYLYPHNLFLNFWSELGLFGLIIFLWIIAKFFYLGFKNKNNILALSAMAAMIALLVHGLVDVPYFKNDLSILFWLIIGIMEISNNQKLDN